MKIVFHDDNVDDREIDEVAPLTAESSRLVETWKDRAEI